MRVSAKIERGQGGRLLAPSRPTLTAEVIRSEEDAQKARGWGGVGWGGVVCFGLGAIGRDWVRLWIMDSLHALSSSNRFYSTGFT